MATSYLIPCDSPEMLRAAASGVPLQRALFFEAFRRAGLGVTPAVRGALILDYPTSYGRMPAVGVIRGSGGGFIGAVRYERNQDNYCCEIQTCSLLLPGTAAASDVRNAIEAPAPDLPIPTTPPAPVAPAAVSIEQGNDWPERPPRFLDI